MSSKLAAIFSKKNISSSTVGTLSNDSMLTLVNEKPTATTNIRQPRPQPFGALATTYGYGSILPGPPPVNPSGSKKAEKARKAAEKGAFSSNTSEAALLNTYGYAGTLAGPPPVNPFGSKKTKTSKSAEIQRAVQDDAFGSLTGTYGFGGALMGPPPVNPSGSSSKKALRR